MDEKRNIRVLVCTFFRCLISSCNFKLPLRWCCCLSTQVQRYYHGIDHGESGSGTRICFRAMFSFYYSLYWAWLIELFAELLFKNKIRLSSSFLQIIKLLIFPKKIIKLLKSHLTKFFFIKISTIVFII